MTEEFEIDLNRWFVLTRNLICKKSGERRAGRKEVKERTWANKSKVCAQRRGRVEFEFCTAFARCSSLNKIAVGKKFESSSK